MNNGQIVTAFLKEKGIDNNQILGIIQHGSTTMGMGNAASDIDIIVILKETANNKDSLLVEIFMGKKLHIRLVKLIEFRSIVSSFQQDVLDTHKDFNLISGRLLAGKILKDSNYVLKKIISEEKKKINFDLLVKKLYFQLLNEINDLATENRYVRNISLNNDVDSLAIMILLKK